MDSINDKYNRLNKLKNRILKHNIFSSASKEYNDFEEVIDLLLEKETSPIDFEQEIQALNIRLNQCIAGKKRALSSLERNIEKNTLKKIFDKRKIGIVGGHRTDREELIKYIKLVGNGASIKFQETPPENVPPHRKFKEKYRDMDVIIAITGYVGHSLTNHVGKIEKECNIKTIFIADLSDIDTFIKELIQCIDSKE